MCSSYLHLVERRPILARSDPKTCLLGGVYSLAVRERCVDKERGQGTADNRTKFAGYYRDQPSQDYANARYYSATTGSFWSPDPGSISTASPGNPTSWNLYAYATADPVNSADPTGRIVSATDCIDNPDLGSNCLPGSSFWGVGAGCYEGGGGGTGCGGDQFEPNPDPSCYSPVPPPNNGPNLDCSYDGSTNIPSRMSVVQGPNGAVHGAFLPIQFLFYASVSSILRHGPLRYLHLAHLRIDILPQVAGTGQPRRVTADHREALAPPSVWFGFSLLERFWFSV